MFHLNQIAEDFTDLLFPPLCLGCQNRLMSQEKYICLSCWNDLPVTHFHRHADNKVARLFWGRTKLEHATSYFALRKGSRYEKIIHEIKYGGGKDLAGHCGMRLGYALQGTYFEDVQVIVPVPLHPIKLKKRGYNQSEHIARGIAEVMNKPIDSEHLVRLENTSTQTKKSRYERWENVEGIFTVFDPQPFQNKHILLVDDVVTTGSTLEACASALLNLKTTRVSIATLAYADY